MVKFNQIDYILLVLSDLNNYMKYLSTYILLVVTLLATSSAMAQKGAKVTGYIIDVNDQKTEGYIEVLGELNSEVKVKFSENKSAKKYRSIKIKDLNGYGFVGQYGDSSHSERDNWRHFVKYEFERPAKVFATNESLIEVMIPSGYYTVYKFLYESGGNVETPVTTRYIVLKDGVELVQIEEDSFDKEVKKLFKDYTALYESIGKRKFRFISFVRLVSDYNFWIEEQHDPKRYKLNPKIYNTQNAQ